MKWVRCIAKDCNNCSNEGLFIGDLCAPCYHALQTGVGEHGTSILFTRGARIRALEVALRNIITDGDYTAPEGMKAIAQSALDRDSQS